MPEDIEDVRSAAITDYTAATGLTDPPTKAEMEAELALIATAINSIILAMEKAGIIADN